MDENTISTEEFFDAFCEDADYQNGDSEAAGEASQPAPGESDQGGSDSSQGTESAPEDPGDDSADTAGTQEPPASEPFTIKVNKEERTVSKEELIALAQKGADYDRVKAQADKGKSDNEALNAQLAQNRDILEQLAQIAKADGLELPQLLERMRIQQLRQKEGLTEREATERLARLKAESQLEKLTAKPDEKTPEQLRQERIAREVEEFQQIFPDVDLRTLPTDKLMADIAAGKTMTQAYQNYLTGQKDAQIARLTAELAAQKQNSQNLAASPGSASDSGAGKTKDAFDDFWSAF